MSSCSLILSRRKEEEGTHPKDPNGDDDVRLVTEMNRVTFFLWDSLREGADEGATLERLIVDGVMENSEF